MTLVIDRKASPNNSGGTRIYRALARDDKLAFIKTEKAITI